MRRIYLLVVLSLALSILIADARAEPQPRQGELKVGDAAPDFTVKDVHGKQAVKLSNLRGKPVVLIFGSCT